MEGHKVLSFMSGQTALENLNYLQKMDLIILDIMLPKISGLELCEKIRELSDVPILFLSAKGTTADRIAGLKKGGTDYLVKPFDLEELILKVSILIRSYQPSTESTYLIINEKIIHFDTFEVRNKNKEIVGVLTKKEIELLRLFSKKAGMVISRDEILDTVWGQDQFPSSRTVDNFIVGFRKLFEQDPRNPRFFLSIRGVGYKFVKI